MKDNVTILRKGEYIPLSGVAKKSSYNMGKEMSLLDLAIRRSLLSETVEVKV